MRRSRFLVAGYTYPIHIVIFERDDLLGYFDPHTYQIGLNITLSYSVKDNVLRDILRHEFAHYIQYIETKTLELSHGDIFKKICHRYGWGKSISKASLNIQMANESKTGNLEMEKIITKIKSLLSLAGSDNENEAQLATIKANQLIYKYNLKYYHLDDDKKIYTKSVLTAKRKNAKMGCIYDILKTFLVRPILVYGKGEVYLEVSGSKDSVELADYIVTYLDKELESIWKKKTQLKGQRAKNSFFRGVAKGYESKIYEANKSLSPQETKELMLINQDLDQQMQKIYRRLSYTSSKGLTDGHAFQSGKQTGKNLTIQSVIKNSKNTITKKLTWSKT